MTPHDDVQAPDPVRTCIGCRERDAKRELLRVTLRSGTDGGFVVQPDPRGIAPGRGAHLHPTTECLELAVRRRAFGRAFRTKGGSAALDTDELRTLLTLSETE